MGPLRAQHFLNEPFFSSFLPFSKTQTAPSFTLLVLFFSETLSRAPWGPLGTLPRPLPAPRAPGFLTNVTPVTV
jgi:hypothetical protein